MSASAHEGERGGRGRVVWSVVAGIALVLAAGCAKDEEGSLCLPAGGCRDHRGVPTGLPNLRQSEPSSPERSSDEASFAALFNSLTRGGSVTVLVADRS